MQDDAMVIAVRVLTAARRNQPARHDDVEELRRVLPGCAALASDELACEVIQKLIHDRGKPRRRNTSAETVESTST
jgi:hypothetical protein